MVRFVCRRWGIFYVLTFLGVLALTYVKVANATDEYADARLHTITVPVVSTVLSQLNSEPVEEVNISGSNWLKSGNAVAVVYDTSATHFAKLAAGSTVFHTVSRKTNYPNTVQVEYSAIIPSGVIVYRFTDEVTYSDSTVGNGRLWNVESITGDSAKFSLYYY